MGDTLTITDNRTGKQYEVPIVDDTIRAIDLRKIKVDPGEFGMMTYDPAYLNTANCRSAITFIDGDRGILRYRGYPIEQLAEHSTFVETAWLLINGELPTQTELDAWTAELDREALDAGSPLNRQVEAFMGGFDDGAHPMGIFLATIGALSTCFPDAKRVRDPEVRRAQMSRLIALVPGIAACACRRSSGRSFATPGDGLDYVGRFLSVLYDAEGKPYTPNPVLERALDILFILHADHEQNCSTSAMRGIGSSEADPFASLAGAAAALSGPLHGGANEAVLRMLRQIGSVDNIPDFIRSVKDGEGRLMGFGHRVYKSYDPRATVIKKTAYEVFEVTGRNPLLDIAIELERIALEDDYFVQRRLYPNVDFYSGLIYEAMDFDPAMFTVLFAIGRTPGWVAQWNELMGDKEQRIARPRQVFTGPDARDYVSLDARG
ncbi:MAG: citrate synthase [Acidobacteria bacterium]|nr:citrate synthase [Acidobacteriota bacterium]MYJ03291.1 citrate synthase [Acidobacteriota bacterium]